MNKTVNITGEVTNYLVQAFEFFNKELKADLDTPVFTLIPNRGRQSYYGWFWRDRWQDGKKSLPEINITADTLKRTVEDICETVIHEMAHYANWKKNVEDCNRNQYHNKHFKKQAEAFGLKVDRMRNKGYALTSLDEKAKEMVKRYKKTILKDEKNPFHAYRVTEKVSTVRISGKRFIAVDRELAEEVEQVFGDQTLRETVENLMRSALSEHSVDRVKELEEIA